MPDDYPGFDRRKARTSCLPPFEEFEEKFRRAFGREMTREERRFYRLTIIVLAEDEAGIDDVEKTG